MTETVESIRAPWTPRDWPNIAYFTHGQAVMDIDTLLAEIVQLNTALESSSAKQLKIT